MSHQVVRNASYGGFSLSDEAVALYNSKAGTDYEYSYEIEDNVARHDPILVDVVLTLGSSASGSFASLAVETIESDGYYIDEYDGLERIITPDHNEWVIIE